jgi:signal peptidase I
MDNTNPQQPELPNSQPTADQTVPQPVAPSNQFIQPQQPQVIPQQATAQPQPVISQPTVAQSPQPPKKSGLKKLFIVIGSIVGVVILIFVVLVIVGLTQVKRYHENGPSMAPTINNGQTVTVQKGYTNPQINDIIVFTQSGLSKYGQPNTLQLIKRVVALSGDRLVIANNKLTVFNSSHPNGFDPDDSDGLSSQQTYGAYNNKIDITVPSGDVYVLGDNRPQSLDSREFGPVPIANVIGKVIQH